MKKKISIYLSQNIFIIVLVFFLSWGLSFLITRDIYSIKDNEKVSSIAVVKSGTLDEEVSSSETPSEENKIVEEAPKEENK